MNRREFMKLLALTPFVGLLKPKPTERIVLQGDSQPPQKVKWSNVQHPFPFDYTNLVGTIEGIPRGKFAAPFTAVIKENPDWARRIAASKNPRLAAYRITKRLTNKN